MTTKLPPKLKPEMILTYEEIFEHMGYISDLDQEVIFLITLGETCQIIQEHIIAMGTMSSCELDLRILLHRVISDKAHRFLVGHNHPDGRAVFSEDDFYLAAMLKYISLVLNYDFVDSVLFPYKKDPVCMTQRHRAFWGRNYKGIINDTLRRSV